MVATDEQSLAERHPLFGMQGRSLVGLPVGDDVGAQVPPVAGARSEPSRELIAYSCRDRGVEGGGSGNGGSHQRGSRRSVGRCDLAHDHHVLRRPAPLTVEHQQGTAQRRFWGGT